jgi:hypothetical protein
MVFIEVYERREVPHGKYKDGFEPLRLQTQGSGAQAGIVGVSVREEQHRTKRAELRSRGRQSA